MMLCDREPQDTVPAKRPCSPEVSLLIARLYKTCRSSAGGGIGDECSMECAWAVQERFSKIVALQRSGGEK